jgi:hypothetical protein
MEKANKPNLRNHLRVAGRAAIDGAYTGTNLYLINTIVGGRITVSDALLVAISLGLNDKMIINSIRFVKDLKKYG